MCVCARARTKIIAPEKITIYDLMPEAICDREMHGPESKS